MVRQISISKVIENLQNNGTFQVQTPDLQSFHCMLQFPMYEYEDSTYSFG